MKAEQEFSYLIYEYIRKKIRFGQFKHGDTLPPIEVLCQRFGVADQTVRSALRRLRAEGYISMHNGRATKVIFQQSPAQQRAYTVRFFSERRASFSDFTQSAELVLVPMLLEGYRRMRPDDYAFLNGLAQRAAPADLLHFFFYGFEKLNNALAMNLLWESSLFLGFAFMDVEMISGFYNENQVRQTMLAAISAPAGHPAGGAAHLPQSSAFHYRIAPLSLKCRRFNGKCGFVPQSATA